MYPIRSATNANKRYFYAELAEIYREKNIDKAKEFAKLSIAANVAISKETDYFNNELNGGKWRFIMSPEMGVGQWKSMRSTPPKVDLKSFENINSTNVTTSQNELSKQVISIEAEKFTTKKDYDAFGWQIIKGLGKSGDSVSVFPNIAKTFTNNSPSLEYKFEVENSADFDVNFFLIPTQPLVSENGLRFAFSIDNKSPQTIAVDKDTEVSTPKWSSNVLNQTTVGTTRITLEKGEHILRIYAVDTGVILDKIILK